MSILKKTNSEDNLTITTTGTQGVLTRSLFDNDWNCIQPIEPLDLDSIKSLSNLDSIKSLSTLQPSTINSISTSYINDHLDSPYINDNLSSVNTIKYVIAGNREQYSAFIKRKGFSDTEYQYLYDADILEGKRNVHGFYVGSWRDREDIEEIKDMIYKCNQKNPNER